MTGLSLLFLARRSPGLLLQLLLADPAAPGKVGWEPSGRSGGCLCAVRGARAGGEGHPAPLPGR